MRKLWRVIGWLAPIALMVCLVTTNVRIATNSLTIYSALFARNDVPQYTGISMTGLRSVGRQIQHYFNSSEEPLRVVATVNGVTMELFNSQEVAHMANVKQVFIKTWEIEEGAAAFLVVMGALAFVSLRRRALQEYGHWLRHGAVLTFVTVGVLGVGSIVAFGPLFTLFHEIVFPEGNWMFSPSDYLVQVFPFGFWQDVTLLIGAMTLIEAAVLFGVGWVLGRQARKQRSAVPRLDAAEVR